jgi:hypothetical protein
VRTIIASKEEVYKAIPRPGMGWVSAGQLAIQFRVSQNTIVKRINELEPMLEMQKINGARYYQKKVLDIAS